MLAIMAAMFQQGTIPNPHQVLFLPKSACKSCPFGVFKVASAKNTHGWLLETHTSANVSCHHIYISVTMKTRKTRVALKGHVSYTRLHRLPFSMCKRHMRMPPSADTVAKPPTKKDHLRWTHHLGNDLPEHRVNPYFAEHHLARNPRGKHGLLPAASC